MGADNEEIEKPLVDRSYRHGFIMHGLLPDQGLQMSDSLWL